MALFQVEQTELLETGIKIDISDSFPVKLIKFRHSIDEKTLGAL